MAAPKKSKTDKRKLQNFRFLPSTSTRLKTLVKGRKSRAADKAERAKINMTSVLENLVETAQD